MYVSLSCWIAAFHRILDPLVALAMCRVRLCWSNISHLRYMHRQVYTRTMFEKFGEALYECGRMISWKSGHAWSTLLGTSNFSRGKSGARMSLWVVPANHLMSSDASVGCLSTMGWFVCSHVLKVCDTYPHSFMQTIFRVSSHPRRTCADGQAMKLTFLVVVSPGHDTPKTVWAPAKTCAQAVD